MLKSYCKSLTSYYQGYSICCLLLLTDLGLNNKFVGEVSNLPAFINGTFVETCKEMCKKKVAFEIFVERKIYLDLFPTFSCIPPPLSSTV